MPPFQSSVLFAATQIWICYLLVLTCSVNVFYNRTTHFSYKKNVLFQKIQMFKKLWVDTSTLLSCNSMSFLIITAIIIE